MATIRSYTTTEQSKVLAGFLPLESADMWYSNGDHYKIVVSKWKDNEHDEDDIPCWSLAGLLNVLPTKLQIVLAINDFQGDRKEKYAIGSVEHDKYDCFADNPVDACYKMIVKLHKLNLL